MAWDVGHQSLCAPGGKWHRDIKVPVVVDGKPTKTNEALVESSQPVETYIYSNYINFPGRGGVTIQNCLSLPLRSVQGVDDFFLKNINPTNLQIPAASTEGCTGLYWRMLQHLEEPPLHWTVSSRIMPYHGCNTWLPNQENMTIWINMRPHHWIQFHELSLSTNPTCNRGFGPCHKLPSWRMKPAKMKQVTMSNPTCSENNS